jgi:heme exporter protein B
MRHLFAFILKYKIKNIIELIYLYIFFIFSISAFALISPVPVSGDSAVAVALLWVVTLFVSSLCAAQLWAEEAEEGIIDQWRASGIGLEWVALAQLLAHSALVMLPMAAIGSYGLKLLGYPIANPESWLMILALGGVQMLSVAMLAAAGAAATPRAAGIIGVMSAPLTIPTIIFGSTAMLQPVAINSTQSAVVMLAGYTLLSAAISCLISAAILESAE